MKSLIVKHSVLINGHKTSVSLELDFWEAAQEIAGVQGRTAANLIAEIDSKRETGNLSSAVRLYVLAHYRSLNPSN